MARQQQNDSIKIRLYNKIAFGYIFNDTDKANAVIKEGKQLAKKANFNFGLTELVNTHGIYMDVTGKSDSASYYFEKALKMSRDFGFENIESMCINNLGMLNWNRGNYSKALDYFFESLKMDENADMERAMESSLNNIGLIYQEMNLNEKALEYHKKALDIRLKYNMQNEQIASYNNIGINLKNLGRLNEAVATFNKGIILAKEKNNHIDYYRLLDNLAHTHYLKGDIDLALTIYLKALEKPKDFNADEKGMISSYNNIAAIYNEKNNPKKALFYIEKGFDLVEKYPETELKAADLYLTNAETQYMMNDYEKARVSKQKFIKLKDSIFSKRNAKAIADLEIKYETEKKEKEILIQRAEIAEQDLIIQQRNYQIFGLIGLAVVLGLLGYLIYNQQELKNRQLKKENELKGALLKIETQNKLQEQRLRISRDLHDNIGAQLTFIISSLDNLKYAFDIKDKKLNNKLATISEFTSGTIYELRDTIWAMNKSEISFEDLQTRISNYIDKAHLYDADIQFSFNVNDSVDVSKTFSSVEGMNIHRIIQEAIHNSLKYAEASKIKVNVSKEVSNYVFRISDDGKGFDLNKTKRGNGLSNMEKRASEINGGLKIKSEPNKGTIIELSV
ncbi:tetratricopeptide repeat protein [Winogradskyella sp.]|uniref:tetratricopeptide repeat-containing sensor histidine kinase n=1 Tax=Winogradskyella sp. TaxID=1883156 RepID=UPI0026169C7C|nr:tetratricopeptide repeat protein [Winogradskyella sp.]